MELEFFDWEEPIDEQELDAIIAAAAAAATKRRRGNGHKPHAIEDDVNGSSAGMIYRASRRRLPNWKAAAGDVVAASSRNEPVGRDGAPGGRTGSEVHPGSNSISGRNELWRNLAPPSCGRVNLKVKYPTMTFGGRIVYSRSALEAEKATIELLEIIKAKKDNMDQISLGFDIEWRPMFRKGEVPRKAAVMQICVDTGHCYVMHIIHSGIPPILQSLLEDSSSVKVGVCIANDALKILKDYSVHVAALDDLSGFANLKLGGTPKKWSLCSLTEMLTGKQLAKPNKVRMGNWEVNVLSREQLQYAATDAFASWYLYEVLKSFPDATAKDKNVDKDSAVNPS